MAERKPFLLRIDPAVLEALQRWANDDLRSLNAQIEFLLRRTLQQAGRAPNAASAEKIVELDDERKAAMVSNLLVVLCGEHSVQPVVNTGTLYH